MKSKTFLNTRYKLTDGLKAIDPWDTDDSPEAWKTMGEVSIDPVKLVPAVQSAWQARCKAISDLPFCIYDDNDKEVDNSDNYKNKMVFLPNPRHFLWLTEAALVGYGQAYWLKSANRYKVVKKIQYFVPTSITPQYDQEIGIKKFTRVNGTKTTDYKMEELLYIWLPDPAIEIGPPGIWPLKSALLSAGALGQINLFIHDYMNRGAVKAMLLTAKQMPDPQEAERVESWFNRFMRGVNNLRWKVFNAEAITPTVVGEGLEAFKGIQILDDLTRQVHTAMGTRHMLEDENYATAQVRQREFYDNTIMPDARLIGDALNDQILNETGYRIEFEPERLEVFQTDEAANATALGALSSAIGEQSPDVIELSMSILGYDLTEDQQALLDKIKASKANEQKPDMINETTTDNLIPDYSVNLNKWMRKAVKHVGKDIDFVCDDIPTALCKTIHAGLPNCKTAEDVRALFKVKTETLTPVPDFSESAAVISGMLEEMRLINAKTVGLKGGDGSGNFGHEGRPGEVGGSAPRGGGVIAGAELGENMSSGINYTNGEKQAATFYKEEGYASINEYLRGDYLEDGNLENIKNELDNAFQKTHLPEDVTVYRGMNDLSYLDELSVGDVVTDKGYVSTTGEKMLAYNFGENYIEIRLPGGTPCLYLDGEIVGDSARDEKEFLLPRETSFQIISNSDGEYILEVINEK